MVQGYGLCQCGCGGKTSIAPRNKANRGHVKGRPVRFLIGHGSRLSPVEYLEQNTGYKTPCWIWQRSLRPNGYAQMIGDDGRPTYAHIVYWTRRRGAVPRGKMLHHRCNIRRCVNPSHVGPVTNRVNTQLGRKAKLSPALVRRIRHLRKRGKYQREIADLLNVSKTTIAYVCEGRIWTNVA